MSYLDILKERDGFGKNATGGASGALYHVTSLADTGPGTLRYALEGSDPLWVVFDVAGTIATSKAIMAKSDKTVDARGRGITIKGANGTGPLRIYDAKNIILLNLAFDNEWEDYLSDSEGADAITILNASGIWIHHCRFSRFSDAAIDTKEPTTNLSVTWSLFDRIWQACAWQGNDLSLGYSMCKTVGARFPKAIDGSVASYNNLLYKWGNAGIQGVKGEKGELLAWRNMYRRGAVEQCNDRAEGRIQTTSSHLVDGISVDFVGQDAVSREFVERVKANCNVRVCKSDSEWKKLYDEVLTKAGPTLGAVSYDTEPVPEPTPTKTLEERVSALEAEVFGA